MNSVFVYLERTLPKSNTSVDSRILSLAEIAWPTNLGAILKQLYICVRKCVVPRGDPRCLGMSLNRCTRLTWLREHTFQKLNVASLITNHGHYRLRCQ